ncbi:UDP-N-acetylmuramate dehydrogenase [Bacillus luti]|nr:UDP-N-acetylmuramate dehydrogenase [Bacillus cereus]HDR8328457.1 UDP-N-acetylmuramate dehydrogenase [Bacillus cereus]HDR8334220.1 UDP-N-acetylmuramate dehydrogenase [Bacillus cereus]
MKVKLDELQEKGLISWRKDEKLSLHTTWKIGGCADYFVEVSNVEGLKEIIKEAVEKDIPYFILGNGSNLLVRDGGIEGLVICLVGELATWGIEKENDSEVYIRIGAGYLLVRFAMEMAKRGYSGLEFAGGIPGTIGGAVAMNAGAHGKEMKDVIEEVVVLTESGEIITLKHEELDFSYRSSAIKPKKLTILNVLYKFKVSTKELIMNQTKSYREYRLRTQPLREPSCGSVFKNPLPDHSGNLVEKMGLRGTRIGGAEISKVHGNFIINTGGATARDVIALIRVIEKSVLNEYGIQLEREVKVIGREKE